MSRPKLLTLQETAERLNTSVRHVRELIYGPNKALPKVKVGSLVRIPEDKLNAYIEAQTEEVSA